jgi:hypothetical protein
LADRLRSWQVREAALPDWARFEAVRGLLECLRSVEPMLVRHMTSVITPITFIVVIATLVADSRRSQGPLTIAPEPTQARKDDVTPGVVPRSRTEIAAARLYGFLTDGEDGCTCELDLRNVTRAFQLAYDDDPLRRPRAGSNPGEGTEPLATDGYVDTSTAGALASYSGHWLEPCYGAWNARCGDVPSPRSASAAAVAGRHPTAGRTSTGIDACWSATLGRPGSLATCVEIRAASVTDATTLAKLGSGARAACGDAAAPQLIHEWIYNERGCPRDNRIAACSAADPGDPRIATVEWFYEGAGDVEEVRQRCLASRRTTVLP